LKISADKIVEFIRRKVERDFSLHSMTAVFGGSINSCFRLQGASKNYFLKIIQRSELENLKAEARGLVLLSQNKNILVPRPLAVGELDDLSLLVLPYLELGSLSLDGAESLGRGLAKQHRIEALEFGLDHNNFIGLTPQRNQAENDWVVFLRDHRLAPQFAMAASRGCPTSLTKLADPLLDTLAKFFGSYRPVPSLLHGDLWSGNVAEVDGRPAIFDPAVYFGDREADIAMTELFGGFTESFYHAYREAWPMDPGYELRKQLYNLYHVLNHFNLFGGGYATQAEKITRALLARVGG
jgi:protein-ribulosamine 3-kinase